MPSMVDNRVVGILIAGSSQVGAFHSEHLQRLSSYSQSVAPILDRGNSESQNKDPLLQPNELLHFSRLVTIGEMTACFSHEVFNHLSIVRGHLRLMQDEVQNSSLLQDHFNSIDSATRRIEQMTREMLDFCRKRAHEFEPCDTRELIDTAVRFVEPYLQNLHVEAQVRVDPEDIQLSVDRWQILHALINLMHNAADAMDGCAKRLLLVSGGRDVNAYKITVSDTGRGIPPEEVQSVFHPFFTTKGDRGTGLGLYIARRVVDEHGGTLSVQTSERGTTFIITLPIH
jgi:signal transduction histidine kinase